MLREEIGIEVSQQAIEQYDLSWRESTRQACCRCHHFFFAELSGSSGSANRLNYSCVSVTGSVLSIEPRRFIAYSISRARIRRAKFLDARLPMYMPWQFLGICVTPARNRCHALNREAKPHNASHRFEVGRGITTGIAGWE